MTAVNGLAGVLCPVTQSGLCAVVQVLSLLSLDLGCSLQGPTERTVLKGKSKNCWPEHRQTLACGERVVWACPPPKGKPDAPLKMSPEWSNLFTKMVFGSQQVRIIGTGRVWKPLLLSCSVTSDSFQPHGLQHTRLPCPSLSPRACLNSRPLSQWCHLTISSSIGPFSCLQSFPASGSFPMSWLFESGGQSIGTSSSASVLPMNSQGLFTLGLTGWISLLSKGLSGDFFSTSPKASILWCSAFFMVELSHLYMNTRKTIALTIQIFVGKVGTAFSHPYPTSESQVFPVISLPLL